MQVVIQVRDHWDDVILYHTSPSMHMLGGARLLGWKYVGLAYVAHLSLVPRLGPSDQGIVLSHIF